MNFKTKIEKQDIEEIIHSEFINWSHFKNSTILVTGATGLIGEQIVKSILYANEVLSTNINILALVRDKNKTNNKFKSNKTTKLNFLVQDILKPIKISKKVDYIIHTANKTASKSFVEQPVETIDSIILGTKNILEFARKTNAKGIIYLSSMEVYGKTDYEKEEPLTETDYGYIDITDTRSSYPEGKRLAENMCIAYAHEYNIPVKIVRLAQTIGAGVDYKDNRVFAQFARNIVEKKDIVLQTEGKTIRSYLYVTDAITGIFSILEKGSNGECYNIANPKTTCSIKELAEMLCNKYTTSKLKIELQENKYYLPLTKYYLDTNKILANTNWEAKVNLEEMFNRLIENFQEKLLYYKDLEKPTKALKYSFIERIFSVKDVLTHAIFCILGIRIKLPIYILNKIYIKILQCFCSKHNKIVFCNYLGKGYGCNPKYICEEFLKLNSEYEIVWLVEKNVSLNSFPANVKIVEYQTRKALYELATAKIWVDNYHKVLHIRSGLTKKENQIYIQTWHGSLGIKKIEKDVPCLANNKKWIVNAINNSKLTDYWISNSSFETEVYKDSFWGVKNIKEFGHPRNDIFFKENLDSIRNKVLNYYNIPTNKKIALYLPSFREDESITAYNLNFSQQIDALQKKFGSEWTFIIRLHPRVSRCSTILLNEYQNLIDGTNYPDIQELLVAGDTMITDYSSCIFDFMLSRKPAFIYATDISEYNNERGFYYPIETTPFPIATSNDEMVKNIENFNYEEYKNKLEEFLKDKGCVDDGHASERVVNLIKGLMNEN